MGDTIDGCNSYNGWCCDANIVDTILLSVATAFSKLKKDTLLILLFVGTPLNPTSSCA